MKDIFEFARAIIMLAKGCAILAYIYLAAFFLGFVFNNRNAFMTVTDSAIDQLRVIAKEAEAQANESEA